jgi:hypothetical protein
MKQEIKVFVVLRLTRGSSEVVAVFTSFPCAEKFVAKLPTATYRIDDSTLYHFTQDYADFEAAGGR